MEFPFVVELHFYYSTFSILQLRLRSKFHFNNVPESFKGNNKTRLIPEKCFITARNLNLRQLLWIMSASQIEPTPSFILLPLKLPQWIYRQS